MERSREQKKAGRKEEENRKAIGVDNYMASNVSVFLRLDSAPCFLFPSFIRYILQDMNFCLVQSFYSMDISNLLCCLAIFFVSCNLSVCVLGLRQQFCGS